MTAELHAALDALLTRRRTLVLAVADPAPWCAPVYFVRHRDRLFFLSNPRSRHVEAARDGRICAASVFRDGDDWRDIEGVQLAGRIEPVVPGPDADAAFTAYVAKFPTVRTLVDGPLPDLAEFAARFRSAPFAFVPTEAHVVCNRLGFASRTRLSWPSPSS